MDNDQVKGYLMLGLQHLINYKKLTYSQAMDVMSAFYIVLDFKTETEAGEYYRNNWLVDKDQK